MPDQPDPPITFATALNCMDGRVQLPVNQAVAALFDVTHVDTITEAGIVKFLSDQTDSPQTEAALTSIAISIERHGSRQIAVVAHADCTGNPIPPEQQQLQIRMAVVYLKENFSQCEVLGLWVDDMWQVHEIVSST